MIRVIHTTRDNLRKAITSASQGIQEPLYRCLGRATQEEYEKEHKLLPRDGCMSVGTGVFFTNDPNYAIGFLKEVMLVTARTALDPEQRAIDTRITGYDQRIRQQLDRTLGPGNYNGWRLWAEIQKNDTLTSDSDDKSKYVYTRRAPVEAHEILAEIRITG